MFQVLGSGSQQTLEHSAHNLVISEEKVSFLSPVNGTSDLPNESYPFSSFQPKGTSLDTSVNKVGSFV